MLLEANEDETISKKLEVMAMENPLVEKALEIWENLSLDEQARVEFQSKLKAKMDYNPSINAATRAGEIRGKVEGKIEGRTEGKTEGKIEATQNAIIKYLSLKFGPSIDNLDSRVRHITKLDVLEFVLEELYSAETKQEAKAVINDGIRSEQNNE